MATVHAADLRVVVDGSELVDAARRGCAQSFARLYDRHLQQVFTYVMHRVGHRATAEDLTADVFTCALRRIRSFPPGVDFGAWLLSIARTRVHDHVHSGSFGIEASVDEVFDTPSPDHAGEPETALLSREDADQVRSALRQLKGEQAEVLDLRFIQHLDVPATALAMGKSPGAVRALQYRALRSLAKLVGVPAPA